MDADFDPVVFATQLAGVVRGAEGRRHRVLRSLVDADSKDRGEDVVAVLDPETGEFRVLLDFDDLMGSYQERTVERAWGEGGDVSRVLRYVFEDFWFAAG